MGFRCSQSLYNDKAKVRSLYGFHGDGWYRQSTETIICVIHGLDTENSFALSLSLSLGNIYNDYNNLS